MAEMVGSAVVQEVVSGAFSLMRNSHEEMASQSHLIERLKWAHLELELALERTQRMPIIEVPLLKMRMMVKQAFQESCDLLHKQHTLRVNLEGGTEQGVTTLAPSLPNRIMHAVKPFFGTEKGSISGSCVRRFEMFAQKTDKFVRDVESGCSLAPYRFSSPLITQLFEGKYLRHEMVNGSQTRTITIAPCCLEDYGVVGIVNLDFEDLKTPTKCFSLSLMLRLSESTDIVGISTKCLQSLGPQFNSLAGVASGELAGISTQVSMITPGPAFREFVFMINHAIRSYRQEPLCCLGDGFQTSAKNVLSSQVTEWFPEQVSYLGFHCFISTAEYNLQGSAVETIRNTLKAWPILQLSVGFRPHYLFQTEDGKGRTYALIAGGEVCEPLDCLLELSEVVEFVPLLAVNRFNREPEETQFRILWLSAHGNAMFTVSKPITEVKHASKVGDGSKTRGVSKRKR